MIAGLPVWRASTKCRFHAILSFRDKLPLACSGDKRTMVWHFVVNAKISKMSTTSFESDTNLQRIEKSTPKRLLGRTIV